MHEIRKNKSTIPCAGDHAFMLNMNAYFLIMHAGPIILHKKRIGCFILFTLNFERFEVLELESSNYSRLLYCYFQ